MKINKYIGSMHLFAGIFFAVLIWLVSRANNQILGLLSVALLQLMYCVNYLVGRNSLLLNPFSVFSVMYSGFAIGGLYYAFGGGFYGKFLDVTNMSSLEIEGLLVASQVYVLICFVFISLGYMLYYKKYTEVEINSNNGMGGLIKEWYKVISYPLMVFGFIYFIWVMNVIGGGVVNSFIQFQLFPHLSKDAGISSAPYMLYYSGFYIYMMGLIANGKNPNWLLFILAFVGFMLAISTARVTTAVTFILTAFYIFYLHSNTARPFVYKGIGAIVLLAFVIYFLRDASNLNYLGIDYAFSDVDILKTIIGGGNVSDLQQLVIIFAYRDNYPVMFGSTYIDWFVNMFGSYFGLSPTSVGLQIAKIISITNSGAPTPSAIGEAYVNFGYGAPFFLFFVGVGFAIFNNILLRPIGVFGLFVFSSFVSRFLFVYPKVDSSVLTGFMWAILPVLLILYLSLILRKWLRMIVCK